MAANVIVDETNIKDVIKALRELLNDVDKIANDTLQEIGKKGETYLDARYVTRFKDPNITDISTDSRKYHDGYVLEARGKDVIYEEFGTGDEGASHPHPNKSAYDLNDYNSGPQIKNVSDYDENSYIYDDLKDFGITSGHFWIYSKDGSTIHYTQGVPAGREMWDTRNYLIKEVIPEVGKRKGREIREKFEKSIKK